MTLQPAAQGQVRTIFSGTGATRDPEQEALLHIIQVVNERFGTTWTNADRLVFDAAAEDLVADRGVQQTAVANSAENFRIVFAKLFQNALIGRPDKNDKVVGQVKDGQHLTETKFFVRMNNASRPIEDEAEKEKYIEGVWGRPS